MPSQMPSLKDFELMIIIDEHLQTQKTAVNSIILDQRSARFHSINKVLIICTQKRKSCFNGNCKIKTILAYSDRYSFEYSASTKYQNSRFADLCIRPMRFGEDRRQAVMERSSWTGLNQILVVVPHK
jgi:hypothetical protein